MTARPAGALQLNAMRLFAGGDARSAGATEENAAAGEWGELIELARQWKILAGLETRLGERNVTLPAAERAELGRLTSSAFVQSTLCIRAGSIALAALERAQIRCVGFKGLATLAFLYPGPRSRTLQDVDVLVAPSTAEAALRVLEEVGFRRSYDGSWDEYLAFVRNSPGSAGNEAISLTDAQGGAVDLHWRLGGIDAETLLGSVRRERILHHEVPLTGPGHSMLLCVHHALRNDFVPDDIARDVCDFAKWHVLLTRSGEWETARDDAERWGLKCACLALAAIVAKLQNAPERTPAFPTSRADLRVAEQLCALYFHQLQHGRLNTDLAYLASHRPALQILAGTARGWKHYAAFMRRSEEVNGELSLSMKARLWRLAKSAAAVSPGRWRQVRALAKSKDRMARTAPPAADNRGQRTR